MASDFILNNPEKVYIQSISFNVPENRVSNDELAKTIDTSDEWIFCHTGIRFRHIADEHIAASDLALRPCLDVIAESGVSPEEIDMILVATTTPDYPGFPSTACILQDKLGAVNAGAMDITAACSGFIYGLETAKNFIKGGTARHILLVNTEVMSKITDWSDRNTSVLLGDGAAACMISVNDSNSESSISFSILGAEGRGSPFLIREAGGSRFPVTADRKITGNPFLYMDGQKVYRFAVRVLCDTIKRILIKEELTIEEISYIVPHQANIRIIEAAAKRLKIAKEKFYVNIEEYGNTSGASIPIALGEMKGKGLLKRGDRIITVGFGAGLTYGGNFFRW